MALNPINKRTLSTYGVLGTFDSSTLRANPSEGAAAPPTGPFPTLSPGISSVKDFIQKYRASLVAQWLRICLPMQGTQVQALVREDPTCRGAAKPTRRQLVSLRSRAREPRLLSPHA